MIARLSLAIVISIAVGSLDTAGASPITYDFTGDFLAGATFNGTKQFSGSFTVNGDPTLASPSSLGVIESGRDVSLTLNVGGQVFSFLNQQNPVPGTALFVVQAAPVPVGEPGVGPLQLEAGVTGTVGNGNSSVDFGLTSYSPAADDDLANLRTLNFSLGSTSAYFTDISGETSFESGATITSIQLVSAPEPSTLVVFCVLVIAAIAHRRRT